jgi:very-short-patch-repair endonuclease
MEMEGYVSTAEERMQNEIDELEQENRLLRARNTRLEAKQWVDLTDRQIESIFIDAGWSWGGKADMYLPAVREVLKLFKETNE